MRKEEYTFSDKKVAYYFDADFSFINEIIPVANTIFITDENVFTTHKEKFAGLKTIVIKAGEEFKQQATVDYIISELIKFEADRKSFIVGVGGGVVTDITGFAASVYMRGIRFGFVPTTVLAMVDASIGGKNGVDVGVYKNLVGLIKQPEFLLYDYSFLQTLPQDHWVNGFAEIIKHACIKDVALFDLLEQSDIEKFKADKTALASLIERNVAIKTNVVVKDEFEAGDRRLLNFGHTLGHAIENIYQLLHGHAISIGIIAACTISEKINNFSSVEKQRIVDVLKKYQLPVDLKYDKKKIWEVLKMDKKKVSNEMNFVLLNKIGNSVVIKIPMVQLEEIINQSL